MDIRSIRTLARVSVCAAVFLVAAISAASGGYSSMRPGPQGLVLVRQPVLQWRISATGGVKVTDCSMTLNGERVAAKYSSEAGVLSFRPDQSLPPGQYSVECSVELDRKWKAEEKWTFNVSKDALESLPPPNPDQLAGLAAANAIRRGLGLPEFEVDASLCASSQSHARFMKVNKVFGHFQRDGYPEFSGVKPIDRAQSFGHLGGVWEDVAMMYTTPQGFVDQLFDAPYHRIPYMQPGAPGFGFGIAGLFSCIDFGSTLSEGLVVSPAADQTGIATKWDGRESPSPLAIHGASGPVGYPIVVALFTQAGESLVVDSAKLSGPAGEVEIWINSSVNDTDLTNAAIIMPRAPLAAGTAYDVSLVAHTSSGKRIEKNWRFTTAP